jgi:hypothetical protein
MGRHSEAVGGWCKLWTKQLLIDKKLSALPDIYTTWFIRALCAANECKDDGRFTMNGLLALSKELIAKLAHIKPDELEKLIKEKFIIEEKGILILVNFEKWQKGKKEK